MKKAIRLLFVALVAIAITCTVSGANAAPLIKHQINLKNTSISGWRLYTQWCTTSKLFGDMGEINRGGSASITSEGTLNGAYRCHLSWISERGKQCLLRTQTVSRGNEWEIQEMSTNGSCRSSQHFNKYTGEILSNITLM